MLCSGQVKLAMVFFIYFDLLCWSTPSNQYTLISFIFANTIERLEKYNQKLSLSLICKLLVRKPIDQGALPEELSAWVVIAGESVRQPEIKALYVELINEQLKILKQLIADIWEGKSVQSNEVTNLSSIILAAMEGAFQLSATAGEVMPKNYAAESVLNLIQASVN